MKVCNKHIISLFALVGFVFLFANRSEAKTILVKKQADKENTLITYDPAKISAALVEEISVTHLDQQNESQTDFSSVVYSNESCTLIALPVLDTYSKTLRSTFTKKQQLLNLIFPFHYFY